MWTVPASRNYPAGARYRCYLGTPKTHRAGRWGTSVAVLNTIPLGFVTLSPTYGDCRISALRSWSRSITRRHANVLASKLQPKSSPSICCTSTVTPPARVRRNDELPKPLPSCPPPLPRGQAAVGIQRWGFRMACSARISKGPYSRSHSGVSRPIFPFALSVTASAVESKSGLRLRCATLRPNGPCARTHANETCYKR